VGLGFLGLIGNAVFLYFLTIVIDFVAKNKGGASAVWPSVNLMSAQMQAGVPVADTGVAGELKVLFEPKGLFIVFERALEIAHLEDRAYPVGVHCFECPEGASFSSSCSNSAARSDGVLEYCAKSELHPASAGLGMLKGR
jgi:hypothetical protein